MTEPDTSVVEQIEQQVAAAFEAKGRELALHGWRMDGGDLPRYATDPHLLTKAVFHGQLQSLLAGAAAGGGTRDAALHGPN